MCLAPQEALLAGCLLLTVAAGWVPLVARFYSGSGFGAKAVAMVAAAGMLVIMLRPPLPIQVCRLRLPLVTACHGECHLIS